MTPDSRQTWATTGDQAHALARQALSGPSGERLVLAGLRQAVRRHPEGTELVRRTGAQVFRLGGAPALRRMAEHVEGWNDALAEETRHHLLSGFWRA